ncbi:MAG: polyphosphate kinase 1 [Lachnospiraceae bacterium]|nr:polyphosphate kinase 1 [Lachnospiraceae bacterium]
MSELTDKYANPQYYHNRELSWLQFDRRCLSEARNKDNPLFERLKFLGITASNLDEFFMVRVASLQDMQNAGYKKRDIAGMTAGEQLNAILTETHKFMQRQYSTYNRQLVPGLKENGLTIVARYEDLLPEERAFVEDFYENAVFPVLTPMAVDNSRPFPLVRNKSLNLCALLTRQAGTGKGIPGYTRKAKKSGKDSKDGKDGKADKTALQFATVQVPDVLPRILELPEVEITGEQKAALAGEKKKNKDNKEKSASAAVSEQTGASGEQSENTSAQEACMTSTMRRIIFLEEIIRHHMESLFFNYDVLCVYPYRVTRNADLTIDEDEASDLLEEIEKQLKKRQRGYAIRLEVEEGIDPRLLNFLQKEFAVSQDKIYEIDGPLDLTFLMKIYGLDGFEWLRENRYAKPQEIPRLPAGCDIFEQIREGDIFMHHPYQTFQPVVNFVSQAADDPDVLAIKQTLYRVSGNSPIIQALARAAENGKQVTVLVELKARFDEEHNIVWARMLEHAGCHVIYGLVGLKTHSKITLVVRREEDGIRRYVHLATGNYNDSTAKIYTDIGLMTCRDDIGEDATSAFNMLSGYSEPRYWNRLALAPLWLKDRFLNLILREARHARNGEKALIKAKMNSLCDPDIMAALYEASSAGVRIDLIVRGICCLRVGIPGVSENIHVRSIVGNFLEHSRIFYFENGGTPEVYAASADWMPRNLDRRVEILFPIEDKNIAEKVVHILDLELVDTVKAHTLKNDGTYERVDKRGKDLIDSQRIFCDEAVKEAELALHPRGNRVFIPAERKEE